MAGATTQAQRQQQVLAAGYNGPLTDAAINQAYANAATSSDLASSGISNTPQFAVPGPAPNPGPTTNVPGVTDPGLGSLAAFSALTSGVTQKQLDQQKAEFDAQLNFAKDQMTQLGIPQLQINQYLAQLQQQQFQAGLATANAAQTGLYQAPQFNALSLGGGGTQGAQAGPGGVGTPTQAAQAQAAQLAALASQQTGMYQTPQLAAFTGNIAYDAYNQASPATQQYYLQTYGQGLPPQAAHDQAAGHYWNDFARTTAQQGGNAQQSVYGSQTPQPTLAAQAQQAQLSGLYQGAPTETAREFNQNLALQQGQLGQQYLATAAQLQGPQNTFQLSNYLRGAQGNQAVPTYLQSLANNVGLPMFQGAGSTAPTPQSAAGLAGQLGGQQSATPGWDYGQTLNSIQRIMQQGAQSLSPGALEKLTPDELQALGSGIGAAGGSLPSFLQQYQQSRMGQQAAGTPALA